MKNDVNLSAGWDTFWNGITAAFGDQANAILTVVGVILVVFSGAGFLIAKLRGRTNNNGKLFVSLIIGAICAAPTVLIPLALNLIDLIINAGIAIYNSTR